MMWMLIILRDMINADVENFWKLLLFFIYFNAGH